MMQPQALGKQSTRWMNIVQALHRQIYVHSKIVRSPDKAPLRGGQCTAIRQTHSNPEANLFKDC